jgi:tetraacyldisaccharide 4'-kinase
MSKLKPLGPGFLPSILSGLYYLIILLRHLWYDKIPQAVKKTKHHTISIGSIQAGGTGKTPLARLIGDYFRQEGFESVFLSRGYGRKSTQNIIVKPGESKSWEEIGDEPAMLHNSIPDSWLGIGSDRFLNATTIEKILKKKAVFILDDGFQHRRLFRDKNVICLSSDFFDDRLIPAGFLREPFSSLKRADIICIIGSSNEAQVLEEKKRQLSSQYKISPIIILHHTADQWVNTKTGLHTQKLPLKNPLLICGIARPHRFVNIVRETGVTPYNHMCYEDHHAYTSHEITELYHSPVDGIITTEKDAIRLSTIKLDNCPNIWYLKINLSFLNNSDKNLFYNSLM